MGSVTYDWTFALLLVFSQLYVYFSLNYKFLEAELVD